MIVTHDHLGRLFICYSMLETFKSRVIFQAFLCHSLPLDHWISEKRGTGSWEIVQMPVAGVLRGKFPAPWIKKNESQTKTQIYTEETKQKRWRTNINRVWSSACSFWRSAPLRSNISQPASTIMMQTYAKLEHGKVQEPDFI